MKEIKSPEIFENNEMPSIFLAGGITDCYDWQSDMIKLLQNCNVQLVNPRRSDFDVTNPNMSEEQIEWEYKNLNIVDAVLFYFPSETLCPITLYELGVHATKGTKLFVGCHPEYKRKFDVIKQLELIRPEIVVYETLEELSKIVSEYITDINQFFKIKSML